jgi:uncharacterized protein YbaP (TraB family)
MKRSRHAFAALYLLFGMLWVFAAQAAHEAPVQGLLFEIGKGSGSSCYLYGTIHSEDERVLDLPAAVAAAFDAAEVFVMEVIPDSDAILRSMVTMVYTDGRRLEDVVGSPLYDEAVAAMSEIGMPEAAIEDFKPWAVVTLLSVPPAETGEFLDLSLYKAATASGKAVFALESIEEQLAVFENLTQREQIALLRETLEVRDQLPAVFEQLLDAYLARDLAELLRLSEEYLQGGDEALAERFKAAALDIRNVRMADRMRRHIHQGNCFIAVGALHLPGEGGVLQRLLDGGYLVERVY